MTDFIFVYQNGFSNIFSEGVFFKSEIKPEFSFKYDTLICESPSSVFMIVHGDKQFVMTESQIKEVQKYCYDFKQNGDYNVYAYDPADGNLYKGFILKSEAVQKNYSYVIEPAPENLSCAYNAEKNDWTTYYAAFLEDGTLLTDIAFLDCDKCVQFLTKEEFEALPKKPHDTDQWDFVRSAWVDKRDLEKLKKDVRLNLRNKMEAIRWKEAGYFTPQYEQDTWRIQLDEALHYKKDAEYPTPYIDTFLEQRTDNGKPSKAKLVDDIIDNHNKYVVAAAKANAIQWNFLKRIDNALSGYAVDAISNELEEYFAERILK